MMPSFSSLLKHSRRESTQMNEQERKDAQSSLDGTVMKTQQSQSKRHLLRNLLKRSSVRSGSDRSSSSQSMVSNNTEVPSSKSPNKPQKPMSPIPRPNKPLPPPPAPGSEPEPAPRPVKKLERIISPIALPDLYRLFSGAPHFSARSEGHQTGAPYPLVAFPWNLELEIRDLSDHLQIYDEAWSSITAWPHITREVQKNSEAAKEHREKQRAHFLPRCRERPSMLSMQGIERGTMGFQAALEMSVADALQLPEENSRDGNSDTLSKRRRKFLKAKDGPRHLNEAMLIDRLTSASTTYHEDPAKHRRPTVELYTELFTQILFPPSRVTDTDDPYSLHVQIEVLVSVLAAPVWFDFSLVEWRIRVGQILWGPPLESDPDDVVVINDEVAHDPGTQKYWLLLQILLSCELLMRLDALSLNIDHGVENPPLAEVKRFDSKATSSVRWSLILARQWLENIRVERLIVSDRNESEKKAPSGWLSSLRGAAVPRDDEIDETIHSVQFYGRHQTRQLSGLLHFAQKLAWPNIEELAATISLSGIKTPERKIPETTQSTPVLGTPRSISTSRTSSYFSSRPNTRRGLPKQRMTAMIHPSGWLSNSYFSGLVLPGEGLSHFLISTLLENDEAAVSRLGEEANLYGGFSYEGKSFWSKTCIVGRVLAAGKGASECMGWISSDVTPRGSGEEWVNIDTELNPHTESGEDTKPRIWHKMVIERHGNVIGGADKSSILPGDFILPSDESNQVPLAIKLESLDLFVTVDSVHTTPTRENPTPLTERSEPQRLRTYSAMMRFSVDVDGEEKKEVNLALSHDVYFVTAAPCVSSNSGDLLNSPTSPSFQINQQIGIGSSGISTGHPLHKAYTFTKLPLSSLLASPSSLPFASLLSPPQSPTADRTQSTTHTTNSPIPKVLVIDCTDNTTVAITMRPMPSPRSSGSHSGSDAEILARAVCAERGWNALISRKGRGCLSCAVREAGALGWRVVLRLP